MFVGAIFHIDIPTRSMSSVQAEGKKILNGFPNNKLVLSGSPRIPDDMITILYTSGSTGSAKGVMIPDRAWNQRLSGLYFYAIPWFELCFQPLAHFNGRYQVTSSSSFNLHDL
jgi:long-subunit acyl-CoA synthetase (AMP-forming)